MSKLFKKPLLPALLLLAAAPAARAEGRLLLDCESNGRPPETARLYQKTDLFGKPVGPRYVEYSGSFGRDVASCRAHPVPRHSDPGETYRVLTCSSGNSESPRFYEISVRHGEYSLRGYRGVSDGRRPDERDAFSTLFCRQ